ncbi:hypothetical protein AC578_3693 [Pseudocercospora eumusae]|uniref:Uncharacterized protein n=1 Tax=Pseudocercospora eumusae TaxID=321146 RepID=A0A139HSS3_9PEZI|nr:hypothetical protein AC578_3693 [Pseudocercospora eumusae]
MFATRKQSPLAQLCDVLDRLRSLSLSAIQDVAREDLSTFFVANHNQPQALVQHDQAVENARLSLIHFESNQVAPAELVRMHNQNIVPLLDSVLSEDDSALAKPAGGAPLTMRMAHLARLKLIGYAIANNFAGIDESTSRDVAYKFLRTILSPTIEGQGINSQLVREISQLALLKPIAETLFRGAVESGDAIVVSHVLSWPGVEVDVDSTVCSLNGKRLTPMEAAASLGDLRLVRLLLQHKADPNKTFGDNEEIYYPDCRCAMKFGGALYHACMGSDPTLELARSIVQYEGNMCSQDIKNSGGRLHPSVNALLVGSAVPQGCMSRVEAGVIHTLMLGMDEEEQKLVLHSAQTAGLDLQTDYHDPTTQHRLDGETRLSRIIDIAAQQGHLNTVRLLREWQHSFTDHTLVAGIRSQNAALLDYLLNENAPTLCFSHQYCTTPFAEAIRVKDFRVLSIVRKAYNEEQLIPDKNAFCAAIAAASEAGNEELLAELMAMRFSSSLNILGYALTRACESDNIAIARKLLDAGASVARGQYTNVMGFTPDCDFASSCPCPLISAVSNRNADMIELLLEHDIGEEEHNEGYDPAGFQSAVARWNSPWIVHLLLKSRFILDTGRLLAAAVEAADSNMVQFLLTDPIANARNSPRYSDAPGFYRRGVYGTAIIQQDQGIFRLLLEHRSAWCLAQEPDAFAAALQWAPNLYQSLVDKVFSCDLPRHSRTGDGYFEKTWFEAIMRKRPDMVHWIASSIAPLPRDRLYHFNHPDLLNIAIKNREETPLRFLIECGLDLDSPLQLLGRLHDGSRRPRDTTLLKYIRAKNLREVKLLLDLGASVNLPAKYGIKRTPLQQAAETGSLSIIELLLLRGADIHAATATRSGGTPAQLAAINGFVGVVQYLDRHGDNIWAPGCTVNGRTALEGAAEHGRYEMVHWLASRNPPDLTQYEKAAAFARDNGHSAITRLQDMLTGLR